MIARLDELMPDLRCPASGSMLTRDNEASLVSEDGTRYPIIRGVPILIDTEKSLFDAAGPSGWGQPSDGAKGIRQRLEDLARRLLALPPTASRNVGTEENYAALRDLLLERSESAGRPARLLVIGGGVVGEGAEDILARARACRNRRLPRSEDAAHL